MRFSKATLCLSILLLVSRVASATEHRGTVTYGGFPVPGAKVTASSASQTLTVTTDVNGRYRFPDLPNGTWKLHVEMMCFEPVDREISVSPSTPEGNVALSLLPLEKILAQSSAEQTTVARAPISRAESEKAEKPADRESIASTPTSEEANEGLLVNGSSNNAATSLYSIAQAFGNQRSKSTALYTGGIGVNYGASPLDAKPYSITGFNLPKPSYNRTTTTVTLGGPFQIPHVIRRGPNFDLIYQMTRNNTATSLAGLMPTEAARNPGFSVDPVAQSLLMLYPLPNLAGNANYNYQTTVLNGDHADAFQLFMDKSVGKHDSFNGSFSSLSDRTDQSNIFHFRDATKTLGLNARVNWTHRIAHNFFGTLGYRFSRVRTDLRPQFQEVSNISGNAGMTGNLQDPMNWGPPTLVFSSGIASLGDAQSAFNRNRTDMISLSLERLRGRHNVRAGIDFRRQEFNYLQQVDARGTFTFTGAAFGNDFSDFLRGVPDAASIAYGNADKYLRQSVYDVYINDDWRVRSDFTLSVGLRWDYGAPIYELKNRLVNLDVSGDFTAASQTLANAPSGIVTGSQYPRSLIYPDKTKWQPRLGISWRPIPGSSMVVRAGYGIYVDTSVYQQTAFKLAQQAPISHTVTANNSDCSQTLRTGPTLCPNTTANTFAIDPNFRVGYAQVWQASVQRDLPGALQMTATYNGIKGLNGVQQFLPNTYAPGASNPCPSCPVGFLYQTSHGNSIRHAGLLQLRRRLRSGLTATALYTYSKSIDNDSMLGGQGPLAPGAAAPTLPAATIAQNWRNLNAERSRSSFDQRHLLNFTLQYTTGMGTKGGTLLNGWRGRLYKEWTVGTTMAAGTGRPLTPVYLAALNGTGYTGLIRPSLTGTSVYDGAPGRKLNPTAYTAPAPGEFGNAGRFSITGPGTLTLDASLSRTFRLTKRFNLDIRADAANVMNHVVFSAYNTVIAPSLVSPTFGLPTSAGSMRTVQITGRLRF